MFVHNNSNVLVSFSCRNYQHCYGLFKITAKKKEKEIHRIKVINLQDKTRIFSEIKKSSVDEKNIGYNLSLKYHKFTRKKAEK